MGGRHSRVRPTRRNYVSSVEIHLSPSLGDRPMADEMMAKDTFNKANNYIKAMKDASKLPEDSEESLKESTFQMVHNPNANIQVTVDILPARNRISLQITDWDTVKMIKKNIQQKEGIPEDQQTLFHVGKMLLDDCTIASCGIRKQPVFHLLLHPLPKIRLSILTPTNDIIDIKMHVWKTIQCIKNLITGTVGVQPDRQKLFYGGKQLEDHDVLADHNFESALNVVYSPIQIFIKMWSGKTITIEVEPFDKVDQVIARIEKKQHFSIKHQSLIYGGRRLHSEETMADYQIQKESTLHLVMAASSMIEQTIRIKSMKGETMQVKILQTDTIASVKEKIYEKYRIHASTLTLELFGKELQDNQTVGACNIQPKHVLYLYYIEWTNAVLQSKHLTINLTQ